VIGMGGYISVPVVLWGWLLRRRILIHNADSVLGNANILLSRFADVIAVSFEDTLGAPKDGRVVLTGLPLRDDVRKFARTPYVPPFRRIVLAVMGGSQGARIFSRGVPEAVALLAPELRAKLVVYQQVVDEDIAAVRAFYGRIGVKAEIQSFFGDPMRILAGCSLFIGRAGASTVFEVGTVGRPAVFVPIEHRDRQQTLNAGRIAGRGGALVLAQRDFGPKSLHKILDRLLRAPILLETMQKNAKIFDAKNNAALNIANIVSNLLGGKK
jgi:UDP-N-acetylglucosamine--N-acetylmuramyl-(pentapeptide) pyrophosphoryl-undecaprenol N-acetylglucosamine transferase